MVAYSDSASDSDKSRGTHDVGAHDSGDCGKDEAQGGVSPMGDGIEIMVLGGCAHVTKEVCKVVSDVELCTSALESVESKIVHKEDGWKEQVCVLHAVWEDVVVYVAEVNRLVNAMLPLIGVKGDGYAKRTKEMAAKLREAGVLSEVKGKVSKELHSNNRKLLDALPKEVREEVIRIYKGIVKEDKDIDMVFPKE